MTDAATLISAARIGWQLLAKVPVLTRWLLRRAFPVSRCRSSLQVEVSGNHSAFELLSIRPSHALANLELRVYNPLPFNIELEATRLQASINSNNLLDAVLNTRLAIPSAGFARVVLPEIPLADQQTGWVRHLPRPYTRVQFTSHWRCKTLIHDWETSATFEFPVFVRSDGGQSDSEARA